MKLDWWHLHVYIEWEPISLRKAAQAQAGLLHAVKLVRQRRPNWSLKEAVDYCKSIGAGQSKETER
jgi:hypothetical protein